MKLMIGSLDDLDLPVIEAHYNPKEIDLAKQASWKDENTMKAPTGPDHYDLEYTGAPPRTMALELLFDGYELGKTIEPHVAALQRLASPIDETASKYALRRPHICVVVWGDRKFPRFQCVIESINVKYTMFARTGCPLRAICQIKVKEIRPQRAKCTLSASPKYVPAPRRKDIDELRAARDDRRDGWLFLRPEDRKPAS